MGVYSKMSEGKGTLEDRLWEQLYDRLSSGALEIAQGELNTVQHILVKLCVALEKRGLLSEKDIL